MANDHLYNPLFDERTFPVSAPAKEPAPKTDERKEEAAGLFSPHGLTPAGTPGVRIAYILPPFKRGGPVRGAATPVEVDFSTRSVTPLPLTQDV